MLFNTAFATAGMNRTALLNCVDDDDDSGNNIIKDFYVKNLQKLMLFPMSSVPSFILRNISVLLHNAFLFHSSEWQEYAFKLGVTNYLHLAKIQACAKASQDQELFITFRSAIPHKSLGHIITILLNKEKYHVLKEIQSDVENLLESRSTTEVKEVASVNQQPLELKTKELTNSTYTTKESNIGRISSVKSLSFNNIDKVGILASSPSLLAKHDKQKVIPLLQSPMNKDFTIAMQNHSSIYNGPPRKENAIHFPSAPAMEKLSVFIQHSEIDSSIAKDLSAMLRDAGIIVRTLSDMNNLVVMDNARGALTTMFKEVDFIIPIVSETLLQQIHPNVYDEYLDSTDAIDNRWLYQLFMNEYIYNRCVNFRVRPVIVPTMSRRLLINDIILSYSFRLWTEVPKLIRILKETKELIPNFSQVNSMKNA